MLNVKLSIEQLMESTTNTASSGDMSPIQEHYLIKSVKESSEDSVVLSPLRSQDLCDNPMFLQNQTSISSMDPADEEALQSQISMVGIHTAAQQHLHSPHAVCKQNQPLEQNVLEQKLLDELDELLDWLETEMQLSSTDRMKP